MKGPKLGTFNIPLNLLAGTGVRINCVSPGQIDVGVDLKDIDMRGMTSQLPPASLQTKEVRKSSISHLNWQVFLRSGTYCTRLPAQDQAREKSFIHFTIFWFLHKSGFCCVMLRVSIAVNAFPREIERPWVAPCLINVQFVLSLKYSIVLLTDYGTRFYYPWSFATCLNRISRHPRTADSDQLLISLNSRRKDILVLSVRVHLLK